ncbi:MAG: hypothetical protein KA293_01545 [Bacteroidia bacterium]|nr:hypothetical protein [Bacteroidia bacterium]
MGVSRQKITPKRKGTSQHSRLSEKLLPEYFGVDERTPADFMAFTAAYANEVGFFDPEAEAKGISRTWEGFFTKDISVVLAAIVGQDVDRLDATYEHLVQKVSSVHEPLPKQDAFEELFSFMVEIARKLPAWLKYVVKMQGMEDSLEYEVEKELWKVIEQNLHEALLHLNETVTQAGAKGLLPTFREVPFVDYLPLQGEAELEEVQLEIFKGPSLVHQINFALVELRSIYQVIINCLSYSKVHFEKYYQRSLKEKSTHHPDTALFMAFLDLYKYAQNDLNAITLRHLEYYYVRILDQKYRPAISDAVHVCFELVNNAQVCRLPTGSLLFAGRLDDGSEIHYRTTEEAEINQTQIASLKSIFVSRVLEGQTWTYKLVTGMYGAPVANSLDGRGMPFDGNIRDWALFGEEQYKAGRSTMQPADIGFAISSPMFMLAEGTRKVKVHLTFSESQDTEGTYRKLIEDLSQGTDEESLKFALLEVFGRGKNCAFNILASGANGWIDVADEASNELFIESRPWSWNRITVAFTIPASCPPIVPIDPTRMNPEGFTTKFPVVKFGLNPRKTPFAYTFLETLRFDQIDIEVEVDKVKSVLAFNDLGRLDSTQPFQAFGPVPSKGSYMLLGSAEIFRKKLTNLKIYIDWQNLPQRGFQHYFNEYFDGEVLLTEDKYKVNLTALSGYEFKPGEKDDPLPFKLFPAEVGKTLTVISVEDPSRLQIRPNPDMREVDFFDNKTPIGFLKLELKEPREAFGHALYQERLSHIGIHNANPEQVEKLQYPNAPFSPLVKNVYLSYRAVDKILPEQFEPTSRNSIYHIHPFGSAPVFSMGQMVMKHAALIPEYREDGYLYIGLKGLRPPQELSLLFQLAAGKTTFTAQLPEMEWCYLSNNDWEPLRTIDILSDTTERFTRTGVIRMRLPSAMTDQNGILPGENFWLRVAIKGDTENLSRALEIRSQAVRAEWVDNGRSERLREPLKAGSIRSLVHKRPEIRGVVQPYPSFHARAAEVRDEFFQRVSERLRHKNRAISHWDFERIILDRFHTINQVKCLSHISDPDYIEAGGLRVVVIPASNQATDELTPKVNHGTLLNIQNYLMDNASPFISLRVSNPSYEYVRVNCRVKFANNKNNGDSLEKLRKDIRSFICPWLSTPDGDVEIGGSLKVEDLYRYIKSLSYVDYVTKFAVLHFFVEDETTGIYQLLSTADPRLSETERSYIRARKPWSVLIPDSDHEIEFTERELEVSPDFSLEPVDFQGRFQISPHLIKILPKVVLPQDNPNIRYEQEDQMRIFVDLPD